jgi:serine/threonine protein kinase
MEVLD